MTETDATKPSPASGPAFLVRALRHRNYRLFFSGQSISLVAGQIPSFLLAPVAGVLVDRWDRHRLLVATQVLAMLLPPAGDSSGGAAERGPSRADRPFPYCALTSVHS